MPPLTYQDTILIGILFGSLVGLVAITWWKERRR